MTLRILAFGIAKEILGSTSTLVELHAGATVKELRILLEKQYPRLQKLASFMIAVNNEYASSDHVLQPGNEIAIIPPVSGG
ncbi:MAG: molybdopterin converting factor subunit 1 [Bacteroidota bacterium]